MSYDLEWKEQIIGEKILFLVYISVEIAYKERPCTL